MAQIIVGDLNDVAALAFGRPDQTAINFIKNQFQTTNQWVGEGQQLWKSAVNTFNTWLGDDAIRAAERTLRLVDNIFQADMILEFDDITKMQSASQEMQKWIMTSPYIKKQAERQAIHGYRDTWVNENIGAYGISDPLYRMSRNGVLQWEYDEKGEECDPFYIQSFDLPDDNVREPTPAEQLMIVRTCFAAEMAIKFDRLDATNPEGAEL